MLETFTFVNTEDIRGAKSTIRRAPYSTRGSTGARPDISIVVVQIVTIALSVQHSHSLLQNCLQWLFLLFVLKSMQMTAARLSPGGPCSRIHECRTIRLSFTGDWRGLFF